MKKLIAVLCLAALTTGAFAQGVVKFANTSGTLVLVNGTGATGDTFYYALLSRDTNGPGAWQFAGIYATNTATAGRFQGGLLTGVTTDNTWAPATFREFEVAGWSSSLGPTWNNAWLQGNFGGVSSGYFGISSSAIGRSGGLDPVLGVTYPALVLFSGTTIATGWTLAPIPEPTTMALAGLGAAALLIFRRRK